MPVMHVCDVLYLNELGDPEGVVVSVFLHNTSSTGIAYFL